MFYFKVHGNFSLSVKNTNTDTMMNKSMVSWIFPEKDERESRILFLFNRVPQKYFV